MIEKENVMYEVSHQLADFLKDNGYKEDENVNDYDRLFYIPNSKNRKITSATHKIAFDFRTIKFLRGFYEHSFECQHIDEHQLKTIIELQKNDKMQLLTEKGKIK